MTRKKLNTKGAASVDQHALEYILALASNTVAAKNHAGAANLLTSFEKHEWAGDKIVPPGSPLHDILEAFKRHTDLPLDLSMHSLFFYISTWLLDCNVNVYCEGQTITPELWTIVLAPSGAGKTYSLDRIKPHSPVQATIRGIKSGAAFFDAMLDNEAQGRPNAMLVDEVGQMIQQIEQVGSPLSELKEYLLLAFGGGEITRKTIKYGERTVNDTTMSFLGLNVDSTMLNILTPASFLDGFCQRFAFVIAERDPERHFTDYPRYNNEQIETVIKKAWATLTSITPHQTYTYTPEAIAAYDTKFREFGTMIEIDGIVNVSFFRRLLQRAHKLALLYHIILGKTAIPEIDVIDVAWAMRLTELHLRDIGKAIMSKSGKAGSAIESLKRMEKQGKKITPSTVAQNVRLAKDGVVSASHLIDAHNNAKT